MPGHRQKVLFVYTNSYDLSVDVLIRRLGNEAVFRLNLDIWKDYRVDIDGERFVIENAAGRAVHGEDVAKFLWRKPLTNAQLYPDQSFPKDQVFEEEELAYAMREVWNAMYYAGRAVLIDPLSDTVAGKLIQAHIARRFFPVPEWVFVAGVPPARRTAAERVAKSLTSGRTGERSMLFTTRVQTAELAPASPWFLQSFVPAAHDVTVVAIRDRLFAFALDRSEFPAGVIDWRRARMAAPAQNWLRHRLPEELAANIRRFMRDMSLHYGRLDFLLADGVYHFLEVNPNGEWGWLDPSGAEGIVDALEEELAPHTACHALPQPRAVAAGPIAW